LSFDDLRRLLTQVFLRRGVSESNASILGENCAACERDGSLSHGIFRIPGYVASLESGWVDGRAGPFLEEAGPAFLRVDAANGFAQPALAVAMPHIEDMTRQCGAAVVAIRNSHHFSALWPDLEPLADSGFVSLAMVAGQACVAPAGGRLPVFGTNPLAFATPVADAPPLIFDFATSAMSNGDLRLAAQAGARVPTGTGVDSRGEPTEEPRKILRGGALLPFGGHKGAAVSLMVEILASALTGGLFSSEVDFSGHPGAETPKTGQTIFVIDPIRGQNRVFASRVLGLIERIRATGAVRLPSDRRYQTRVQSITRGIPVSLARYEQLASLANPSGLN
jgi:delta1-piperideine-2-carboxylate reductase